MFRAQEEEVEDVDVDVGVAEEGAVVADTTVDYYSSQHTFPFVADNPHPVTCCVLSSSVCTCDVHSAHIMCTQHLRYRPTGHISYNAM